jgi:hypothetical protein
MKTKSFIAACIALMFLHAVAFAMGGAGATCNPSTANWGNCTLSPVPFQNSITHSVKIPAGHYATPYQVKQTNTEYILQGDITADGTAIEIRADYVVINLNGHTITYNLTSPGEGIKPGAYHYDHVSIRNGSVIQGPKAMGKIISTEVVSGGLGYTLKDILTLTGDRVVENATATVSAVASNGTVTGITLNSPGVGYEISYSIQDAWNGYDPTGVIGGSGKGAQIKVIGTSTEGDIYGVGMSAISASPVPMDHLHVANVYIRIVGRDVGGIVANSAHALVEETTIEDTYHIGTVKHRHQGVDALTATKGTKAPGVVYRNNTILNCRHKGIAVPDGGSAFGNHITTRTIATNGAGIGMSLIDTTIHSNSVISRGQHPIGIFGYDEKGFGNTTIYNNYLDSRTTELGVEYGSAFLANPNATVTGNAAVGFRTTWGGNGINFHNNEIHVTTDSRFKGIYTPTGAPAYINARGRGLMVGIKAGEKATFSNNTITVLDKDGKGLAYGIACTGNYSDKLFFIGNTVTSNVTNVALGDEYSLCNGFPLFKSNTFIKAGNYPSYRTISAQAHGLFDAEARIVDNIYLNGSSVDSLDLNPSGYGVVDVYFGSVVDGEYRYGYRLHDSNNTSKTLLREEFKPMKTLTYDHPDR